MQDLKDKRILVKGAAGGISQAIVAGFQAAGATAMGVDIKDSAANHSITDDLTDAAFCHTLPARAAETMGGLDILINNAGLMQEGTALESREQDWADTLQVNLAAPFLLTKAALPRLIQSSGAIVNIGSIEGPASNPRHPAYCASKAGLHGLTRAVAVDHGRDGVRCNAVGLGWIDTDLNIEFIESLGNLWNFAPKSVASTP